jgi:hypothetical protein
MAKPRCRDRFRPHALRPLPALAPDYCDTAEVFLCMTYVAPCP